MKRTWYCCQIVNALPIMSCLNGPHFRQHQHCSCSQVDTGPWLLFDGRRYAAVLSTEQAKAALESRRDSANQRVLAPQATEERFLRSIYGQTGRRTRRERRFW